MNQERVVITGVSRGLGRALAEELIGFGHVVMGCSRSEREVAELQRRFGPGHQFTVVDVRSDTQVKRWAEKALTTAGPPDRIINNAGVINRNAPLWELKADEVAAVLDVNITGVINVLRHFLPSMVARRRGVVVNFSSGWGRSVDAEVAPYCASKWAIEGLTQALACELPAGMAAIPLNPGIINTAMLQSCFGESANGFPQAQAWAKVAAPFIMNLGSAHNGKALSVPTT